METGAKRDARGRRRTPAQLRLEFVRDSADRIDDSGIWPGGELCSTASRGDDRDVAETVQRDSDLHERISEERKSEVDVSESELVKRKIVRPKYRHRLDRGLPR